MKVFISHKKEDSTQALRLKTEFERNSVDAYLDVLDSSIILGGKELTEHIKANLNSCTDIIVIMSERTKFSWWVPFEIGMSAQVDMPTATFLSSDVSLPDYLNYWPRLKTTEDVKKYISARKKVSAEIVSRYGLSNRKKEEVHLFYETLKRELR